MTVDVISIDQKFSHHRVKTSTEIVSKAQTQCFEIATQQCDL